MATAAMRRRNKSLKMITTVQYLSPVNNIYKALVNINENCSEYDILSYDPILKIMHLVYKKRLVLQNIYIILEEENADITNVTIEVINDKSMVTTNYEHKVRVNYVIKKITNELNMM